MATRHLGILALVVLLASVPVFGDASPGERERALEERIESLERMVQRLLDERGEAHAEDEAVRGEMEQLRQELAALEERDAEKTPSGTEFNFTGFIKHDMMYSRYSAGSVPPNSILRDFHVPAAIPVGGQTSATDFDTHIRETRFIFDVQRLEDDLQAYLEFDFSAGTGGDERLTNTTSPNIRHAFVRWNDLLAGQTWTTFFNVGALPENVDFIGPAEGTIFVRQAQLRYTNGPWQFALENPETTVTPFGGGARIVTDTASIPDLVARYNHDADWGQFSVAALGRQLGIDGVNGPDRETSFALSLSGRFDVGQNDIRWMVSGGPGIGRYLGLNTANEAVLDADGRLDTIDAYGGFLSYRHLWNDRWRSNFTLSAFRADNDTDLTGMNVTKSAESAHANLIYQATPQLRFGLEYQHARREIEAGLKGNMNRLQFATIYAF
ncbi:porin [Wenzhouxiangella sp. AB-CW3]|uniref:DcaP family trimeric outer membrane transporter n=1 Tax=Wenzhouxiangella sp. AB-CW3 TaxID=2771012 RepID=UPI00168ADD63|nr:DcaP family trimeric outer membrane transporter [Wenzhouxiangella sp. AB-CW3]QOC22117.1 porin [Wenzhouxiangella sp. AB-CW3]